MKITIIAGARPNFMKIAPIIRAFKGARIEYRLVHTGQHYDEKLSGTFFKDLQIPLPDVNLEVGAGSHAEQTAKIMMAFEKELAANLCDFVLVVGDVNSTLACSLVAKKMNVKVIHVEAGLRSRDMTMPEEINRIVVDSIADVCFITTHQASQILVGEGKQEKHIHLVGNVMIDTLFFAKQNFKRPDFVNAELAKEDFFTLTLHRPSNVDDKKRLMEKLNSISDAVGSSKVIFPIHPRTRKNLDVKSLAKNIIAVDPLGYFDFMYVVSKSIGVITDSGGVQEETTSLGIPCLTMRNNTERPETVEVGTNELVGDDLGKLREGILKIKEGRWKSGGSPELWDGEAAKRIANVLLENYL